MKRAVNIFTLGLGVIALILVVFSLTSQLLPYFQRELFVQKLVYHFDLNLNDPAYFLSIKVFNLDAEKNIPTAFSFILLLMSALLLFFIAVFEKQINSRLFSFWAVLCIGFSFMAIDEQFSIHEKLAKPIRELIGTSSFGIFYFSWVIPAILLIVILAPFFYGFLVQLERKTRNAFLFAAVLYIGGSIGFELLGGYVAELVEADRALNSTYIIVATIEETLEITGTIVFIRALLQYIARNIKGVSP